MNVLRSFAFTAALAITASAVSAQDIEAAIQQCNDCHGDKGVSLWNDMPTIAGISEFVHSDALFAYRDKKRPCDDSNYRQGDTSRPPANMCDITEGLSDSDIEAFAAAYAQMPYVRATQDFDAALAAAGKRIHDQQCDRCHSDAGTNVEDDASMLGGQWMGYLETTFAEYAAGTREQPAKMKDKLDKLSSEDVKKLLHYYAGQQ